MSRVLVIGSHCELSRNIADALAATGLPAEQAMGHADALHRLRMRAFGVVITSPDSAVDEDLALLEEMRDIRPGVKCIVLARESTPDDVIAALRAQVFACFSPPFDGNDIAELASRAATDNQWRDDIQVLSARPGWVSVRVNCRLITAERLMTFARELTSQLPEDAQQEHVGRASRDSAQRHGARRSFQLRADGRGQSAFRPRRSLVFYVRDPGAGFRRESLSHAAVANPSNDPVAHILKREEEGMRPGGYGLLLASGAVDELLYNEVGNQVLLIKYLDPPNTSK